MEEMTSAKATRQVCSRNNNPIPLPSRKSEKEWLGGAFGDMWWKQRPDHIRFWNLFFEHCFGQLYNSENTLFLGYVNIKLWLFHMWFMDTIFLWLYFLGLLIYIQFLMPENSMTQQTYLYIFLSHFLAHLHLPKYGEHWTTVHLTDTWYLNHLSHWIERFGMSDTISLAYVQSLALVL